MPSKYILSGFQPWRINMGFRSTRSYLFTRWVERTSIRIFWKLLKACAINFKIVLGFFLIETVCKLRLRPLVSQATTHFECARVILLTYPRRIRDYLNHKKVHLNTYLVYLVIKGLQTKQYRKHEQWPTEANQLQVTWDNH